MEAYIPGLATALWLGILTSISPCPLATNIAAVSYISKRMSRTGLVFLSGIIYTFGRMLTYLILGILLVASLISVPELAYILQKHINQFLGPLLVITGIFLLGIIPLSFHGGGISEHMQKRVERYGIWGAGLLGFIFALSFCPVSAAIFFGSLIPLAVKHDSGIMMPLLYGLGTALPVFAFSLILAFGARHLGKVFNHLSRFELWARRFTAFIFILVGVYYILIYLFKLSI